MCWDKILIEGPIIRKWMVFGLSISFGVTIYLLFLISSSFQNYAFSPDLDDLMNNWRKEPISLALTGSDCNEFLNNYQWNGIRSGCDCTGSTKAQTNPITFFTCSRDQLLSKCINVENINAASFNTWPSSSNPNQMFSACLFRLTGENFINSYAKQSSDLCGSVTIENSQKERQKCGFDNQTENSYKMCLTKCPYINILGKDDSVKPEQSARIVGSIDSTFFYTTSSEKELEYPIVDLTTQIPTVCMYKKGRSDVINTDTQNVQYNSKWQFTLQRNYLTEECKQQDTRYFPIQKMDINEQDFLIQNGFSILSNYPGYPTTSSITLYARRIISWSGKCRSDGKIEELIQFYNNIDYQINLRLLSILCLTFMVIILCVVLVTISCEIGWRLKSNYCCRYQAPRCLSLLCRKKELTNNEISFTDYWRLYDPCYVVWMLFYSILQISCFVTTLIFAVKSSITTNQLKSISKSYCSDDLTNSVLINLSNDFQDDIWSKDSISLITYPLFIVVQVSVFVVAIRIVTNHKREWFIQKMMKRQKTILNDSDPILTSEESEEENFKKNLAQQKVHEQQRQQQNQVLQADFIQRANLINQSLSYFNTSRNNITNNAQTYQYELSRITYLQQSHSFNNSFLLTNHKNYNSNSQNYNQNNVNISIPNSLNNSIIQENSGGNNYSQDSKQANPPSNSNESNKTNSIFQNNQKKQFNKQSTNPMRSVNGLNENFLGPEAI